MTSSPSVSTAAYPQLHQSLFTLLDVHPSYKVKYSIAACSSFSGQYEPANILYDRPHDLSSRWSGASVTSVTPSTPKSLEAAAASAAASRSSREVGAGSASGGEGSKSAGSGARGTAASSSTTASGSGANGKQYLILELDQPAIVKSILFGKFHKAHPCNLRDFKVYGGPSPDPNSGLWMRLLRAGLRNDATPEEFPLKWHDSNAIPIPVRYIKLVPLVAHVPNYNSSVWFVELKGVATEALVTRASEEYQEHCDSLTTRMVLKHLRAKGHQAAFEALLKSSHMEAPMEDDYVSGRQPIPSTTVGSSQRPFEHPIVSQLLQAVMRGDWDAAEDWLERSARSSDSSDDDVSLFAAFVSRCPQQARWSRLNGTDADGDVPSARGGHQLVVDSTRGTAYLFGGWDGKRDLNDLWMYYIDEGRWRCISRDTTQQGGPSPRSCHKMVLESRSGIIYLLGRFVDHTSTAKEASQRSSSTQTTEGELIAAATATAAALSGSGEQSTSHTSPPTGWRFTAGPSSISSTSQPSSQSPATNRPPSSSSSRPTPQEPLPIYASDFFRFATRTERWDRLSADTTLDGGPKLIYDHQMAIDEESQILYVFGGRVVHWDPNRLELSGMWRYDCIQRKWAFVFDDDTRSGGKILSRSGHSMLLDAGVPGQTYGSGRGEAKQKLLWVLAGQRGETYLADMYSYNLTTGQVREVSSDYSYTGPEGGFTQRATIDVAKREIYLFSGLVRREKSSDDRLRSALWLYSIERDQWSNVWQGGGGSRSIDEESAEEEVEEEDDMDAGDRRGQPSSDSARGGAAGLLAGPTGARLFGRRSPNVTRPSSSASSNSTSLPFPLAGSSQSRRPSSRRQGREHEPRPRYASQMVYDPLRGLYLLFGGNPAHPELASTRLDDLWSLRLLRPTVDEILRRAKLLLRQQKFKELAAAVPSPGASFLDAGSSMKAMEALMYLQTSVSEVVDHQIPEESKMFRQLVSGLLSGEMSYPPAASEVMGPPATVVRTHEATKSKAKESDGLPAINSDESDDEMLSISQTLPPRPTSGDALGAESGDQDIGASPSSPPAAHHHQQRLNLFHAITTLYPPEVVEPIEDLGTAIGTLQARRFNRGGMGGGDHGGLMGMFGKSR